jgi:hypothetical protein
MALLVAFREGGAFMFVVVGVAVLAVLVASAALGAALFGKTRQPGLALGLVAMLLCAAVPASGLVGYLLAMRQVERAITMADAASRAALLAQGTAEAMNLIAFGFGCALVPFFIALAGTARAAFRPKA